MKDVVGYEGLYAVTSCGKVYSYKSKKFLKPWINKDGYLVVKLRKDGERKNFLVHRLVAETYVPNPDNLETVDHIDGCKDNNNIFNLQLLTRGDNARKAHKGKKHTEETKRKMSESQKGKSPWITGKKHTEKTKSKIVIKQCILKRQFLQIQKICI